MVKHIKTGLTFVLLLGMFSCVSETRKAAQQQLDRASALIAAGDFEKGMQVLDSIPSWFPQEYGVINQANKLNVEASTAYHQEFIKQAQSLLDGAEAQIEEKAKNFILRPGPPGRPGFYEHKRQTVRQAWNRIFLKVNVTEDGQFWLTSHYYGKEWLDHTSLKVYDKGLYEFTDTLGLGHPDNHKIEDGEDRWEKIDFRNGSDRAIVPFIIENQDKRLKVRFTGKKHYYIVMETFDKSAVKEGYELAQVLKEVFELREKISRHEKELRLLGVRSDE